MKWYLIIIIALIIVTLSGRIKSIKIIYLKNLTLPLLCVIFILCLIMFSETAVSSAYRGIKLWIEIVFPSLFPFFIASELLNKTGFVRAAGILLEPVMRPLFNVPGCGSFAFAMGITSGYPVGAKITTEMRKDKLLTKMEAERLLTFTNNSGPLFIIGAVAVGMFKMPQAGLLLLGCHISACITVGIIFRFYGRKKDIVRHSHEGNILKKLKHEIASSRKSLNLGIIFGDAVRNSVNLLLAIGGFIIFFSVIINLLLHTGFISSISKVLSTILAPLGISKEITASIISGFFEITTGTNMASKAANSLLVHRLTATSFIIGWAGLSVHSQVFSIISGTDISIKPYLLGKFIQGICAGIYTYTFLKVFNAKMLQSSPAFIQDQYTTFLQSQGNVFDSFRYLTSAIIILTALAIFTTAISHKKAKSCRKKARYSNT